MKINDDMGVYRLMDAICEQAALDYLHPWNCPVQDRSTVSNILPQKTMETLDRMAGRVVKKD